MSKKDLYTGRAGHLAVMAELLIRGWNTAIPEVDVGDDIFVVHDSDGNLHRVQVKTTATSKRLCCMKPGRLCWPLGFLVYAFFVIG